LTRIIPEDYTQRIETRWRLNVINTKPYVAICAAVRTAIEWNVSGIEWNVAGIEWNLAATLRNLLKRKRTLAKSAAA
jgi:hypothetical protein